MSGREAFHSVLAVGLLLLLVVGLYERNWPAVGWACFGLASSALGFAQGRHDRRGQRS